MERGGFVMEYTYIIIPTGASSMTEENQYQTPNSNVETSGRIDYGEVKLFAVSGRIGRIRYIAYHFGLAIVLMVIIMSATFAVGFSASAGDDKMMGIAGIIMVLLFIIAYGGFFVLSIMLTIQRSHDFNASGWLCLVGLVPLASLIFLFIPGTDGENDYGLKTPPNGGATVVVIIMALLIPIMGILAAIAIPAYQGYIDQANQLKMEQSLNN